jgi:hypothetical protein
MLKNNAKMFRMLLFILGIDQDVIDENHHEFIQFSHEVHEVGRCISETEGHNLVFIQPITCGEGNLRNITRPNFYLMITRPKINFGKDLGFSQLIKQHINAGQGVFIFDDDRIERALVYA